MRILIGSPLQQDPDIFREHRKSLERLNLPEGCTVDFYWVVNDCPEIINQLHEGEYEVMNFCHRVNNHHWELPATEKMSVLRTVLTERALSGGYDYYLSVDSDIIVEPDTLIRLLETKKDLVSEVFWTRADDGKLWCNSWMYDQYDTAGQLHTWLRPGLYEVGMTGALFLISRAALEAGVSYRQIANIKGCVVGEDRHFCIRAACAGFKLYMDTTLPAFHMYRRRDYEAYMEVVYGHNNGQGQNGAQNRQYWP